MKKYLIVINLLFSLISISDLLHHRAFIPISTYAPGAYNTFWKTDLCILNADTVDHKVSLYFYSSDNSYDKKFELNMNKNESKCILNIVKTIFKYEGNGLIYVEADAFFAPIGVTTRIYTTRDDGGTYGQTVDDQIFNLCTKTSYVLGIKKNEDFRTNIGISMLPGLYSSVSFNIEVYDKQILQKKYSIKVNSPGVVQIPIDIDIECGFAKFIPEKSNVTYLGYISVVDNKTGDAVFIPAKDLYEP